ncbi:MAG: AN1-type zinc finger protein [Nitrososphaeria archaeon]
MKCEYCGQDEPLPFKCSYCGKFFCIEHRLPEKHSCEKIVFATPPSKRKEVYKPRKNFGGFEKVEFALATTILFITIISLFYVKGYEIIFVLLMLIISSWLFIEALTKTKKIVLSTS